MRHNIGPPEFIHMPLSSCLILPLPPHASHRVQQLLPLLLLALSPAIADVGTVELSPAIADVGTVDLCWGYRRRYSCWLWRSDLPWERYAGTQDQGGTAPGPALLSPGW